MKTKPEGISELYRRLNELPRARTREEAHEQIHQTLEAIETERRGLTYEQDMNNYGRDRMGVFPLTSEYWTGLTSKLAWARMINGFRTWLHSDGTIEITQDTSGGERTLQYRKAGGIYSCERGHWLADQFIRSDLEGNSEVDPDYVWLSRNAARTQESRGCKSCGEEATFMDLVYGHRFPQLT